MSAFRACAVIPTRNHVAALGSILLRLHDARLPAIVVDDGSDPEIGSRISAICATGIDAEYRRHASSGGKGFAVMRGLDRAYERGFSHAVQIDADGQHDLESLDDLLSLARLNTTAIVCGVPRFDRPIPLARRIGRPITNFWVAVNSLSSKMPDAMCGFRVYPVATTLSLVRRSVHGRRMDFDVEVLVKAHWAGIPLASVPVRVRYPEENLSNFNVLRDNLLLAGLQARLFLGMLPHSPGLLFRRHAKLKFPDAGVPRWASTGERGSYLGMRVLAAVYRLLGRRACEIAMIPVVFYFFVTGREQRAASREYLAHLWQSGRLSKPPTASMSFRHFLSFGESVLDRFAAGTGNISRAGLRGEGSLALLDDVLSSGRGVFVITAHIGSPDVIRTIASVGRLVRIKVLMHTEHAQSFNRLIATVSPESPVRAIAVSAIGIDTAIVLADAIARGEWVVMAGDRSPVSGDGHVVEVPFLGEQAIFPQGPYILGSILKAPTFLLFCVRRRRDFCVHFSKFADPVDLPRGDRAGAVRNYARAFAKALEDLVGEAPLQWFNFYSFWDSARARATAGCDARSAAE